MRTVEPTSALRQQAVGKHVRRLRQGAGLSVREMARRAGFSPSFMSQVETGRVSPSIGSMGRIANVLGVGLGEFFAASAGGEAGRIVRPAGRRRMSSGWSKAEMEGLSVPGSSGQLEVVIVTMQPGGRSGKRPYPHPHEEFAFVLQGEAVLTLGDEEHRLRRGDAAGIPAGELRLWRNGGRAAVRIMLIDSPVGQRAGHP